MDLNTAMRFVMMRAQGEATAVGTGLYPEHLFLGLLKLSEVTAEDVAPASRHKPEMNEDIRQVASLLKTTGIDSGVARQKLRRFLRNEKPAGNGEQAIATLLAKAAAMGDGNTVVACLVLSVMLMEPTPMLAAVFPVRQQQVMPGGQLLVAAGGQQQAKQQPAAPAGGQQSEPEETGIAFLQKLTDRIRAMRYALLEKVHGQDHVVHAFAEGMFNAAVLVAADETRKRPRAIFVFAGPPGVGKTFLAEQAAEALAIPFKRFDMSNYADHQAQTNLIGYAPSFKDAKPGQLTGFVKENPLCMLLFDEIEKAHLNTIMLFLQILDAGQLHDDFSDEMVAFKDTVIIFTSNAGRQLYEGDHKANAAGLPRQTILSALESDTHPQTGKPFFPTAICSRLATGYPMMYNHLQAHNLEKISAGEFNRFCKLFEKQYQIAVDADKWLATVLLFAEGGQADARTLRAQTELFFKNEIFKLCQLWGDNLNAALERLKSIHFEVTTDKLPDDVKPLFHNPEQPEILLFGDILVAERLKIELSTITLHATQSVDEALKIVGEQNICFVLMELLAEEQDDAAADPMATRLSPAFPNPVQEMDTIHVFDHIPSASTSIRKSRKFFQLLRERLPEIPVYLLETGKLNIDNELLTAFVRAGARGKMTFSAKDVSVLVEEMNEICAQSYLQTVAAGLAAQHKVLSFETAPILSADKTQATIRLREISLRRAVSADDSRNVLDEAEKPKVRFSDVIGASGAKEELQFFINFLKNPKKFTASGLKPPKGVLLYGPPGTGKTLLAKAMAGESDVAFIPAVASAFVTKFQGSGPEAVRELFGRARRYAPAIVFIDEIDAVGRARGGPGSSHGEEMALNALLTELDGFSVDPKRPVFVLAATNFDVEEGKGGMGTIDGALARRFDRKILVDLPNKDDRRRYFEFMLGKRKNHQVTAEMLNRLSGRSTGLSLANLESVIETASRMAAKKDVPLSDELLEEAFELSRHGEKKDWGHGYLERVARHEAGHAYMCFLAGSTPSYLTIVARGDHGGYMEHADDEGSPLKTKEALLGRIRTSLGGRAAEIVFYGEKDGISTGASGDLQGATQIARGMICSYGMDEEIGLAVLSPEEATKGPMAEKISRRISQIIEAEMKRTVETIAAGKPLINKLVEQLLEKNKLTKEEMEQIFSS